MLYANLLLSVLYHIVMEMKIRESCLQTGTFIYKPGISVTKQDFHLQSGSLGLQMGFSGYYLPKIQKIGVICSIVQIILSIICLIYNAINQENIIIWILLLCSGIFLLSSNISRNNKKEDEEV